MKIIEAKQPAKIKGLEIGRGIPKICVSINSNKEAELVRQVEIAEKSPCQLIEWRIDYFDTTVTSVHKIENQCAAFNIERVKKTLKIIKTISQKPIIVTLRSQKEGGKFFDKCGVYKQILREIILKCKFDVIDIEFFSIYKGGRLGEKSDGTQTCGLDELKKIVELAHETEKKVIISSHDFEKTPSKNEIIKRFQDMELTGADIIKIAVMPKETTDLINLVEASTTITEKNKKPIVSIAMGQLGQKTRIEGGTFGSAISFASLKKENEVDPLGQVNVYELDRLICQYYGNNI